MITGTAYFVSRRHAIRYYRRQGDTAEDVDARIDAGEIHIGIPPLQPGNWLMTIDKGCRYAIVDDE